MDDRLLTRQQVEKYCGLSCSTIYRLMRGQTTHIPDTDQDFPEVGPMERERTRGMGSATRPRATGDFPL